MSPRHSAQPVGHASSLLPDAGVTRLRIANRSEADEATLILAGEIDFDSAPALETQLHHAEKATPGRIVLDLAALDFIDSTGIHLLVDAQQRAERAAHRLVLTRVPPHAQRLFNLTGTDARVAIE